jgi:Tfp pilus assembly protein PilN
MIRINLLGLRKEVAKSRMPSISMEGAKATALFVIILALAVLGLVGHYWMLSSEKAKLDDGMKVAEAEKARLARVKAEYEQFQTATQALQRRINIIEGLKNAQTGPVTLLNTLAATVESSGPIWLAGFEVDDKNKIVMAGVANSVNTVADFITNLKSCGQFKNVEITELFQEPSSKQVDLFVFAVSVEMATPEPSGGRPKS